MATNHIVQERRARARALSASSEAMNAETVRMIPEEKVVIQDFSGSPVKPKTLTLLHIFLLNAVVCGVEICACAGFTFIPPMLLKSGYTEENMSIILGLGPLLGFFLVPLIGRASDQCQSSMGRRRPFILVISLVLLISLIVIPYGDTFCKYFFGKVDFAKSVSLLLLTLSVVLLDFTSQACLTPCEALLSDASKDTDQHERVFIVYSLMVSLGGFIGYLITALDWNTMHLGTYFGNQEKTVFSLLIVIFTVLMFATVFVARETPYVSELKLIPSLSDTKLLKDSGSRDNLLLAENGILPEHMSPERSQGTKASRTRNAPIISYFLKFNFLKYLVSCKLIAAIINLFYLLWMIIVERLPEPIKRLCEVPYVLRYLALAHFCSWTAVMGFNLFYTDYVGNAVYQGNPNAPEDSYLRDRFDEGVRMGSWGLLLHCITSATYALLVERFVERYGCKKTYMAGMVSFSCAMFGMVCVRHIVFVNIMAALTGFGYATVTTIPFILVTKYHNEKEIFFYDVIQPSSSRQALPRGIATDMATLDSAYFLSQVILSGLMGYIVYMTGSVLSYMVTAGVMGILSCFIIQKVVVIEKHLAERQIKKEKDVVQLYLANKGLKECEDLSRFKYLKCLWLNGNKLRRLDCLRDNFQLAELYLQNNQLVEVFGALQHLTCLQVLMLQNNQLTKLDKLLKELKKMQCLKTLNLFNNPVAQESDYRLFVIHSVPSVDLLDRQEVLKMEREAAKKIYDQEQEKIRDTVAFGRRSHGPPALYYPTKELHLTKFGPQLPRRFVAPDADTRDLGNSFLRDSPHYATEDDALNARRLKKSVTLYTTFDWSKVPRLEERRQAEQVFDSPEIITHVYR